MSTEARAVPGWRRLLSPGSVLPYLAPWWILVPVIGVLLHNARVDSLQAPLRAAEAERVRADADLLRRSLDRLRNDIRLVVHVARSELLASPQAGGGREALVSFLHEFLETFPGYRQARLLDLQCHERVRLERRATGVETVAAAALQDKSGHSYCLAGQRLAADEYFISRLDANVEHGQIVRPLEPMLRIAARIFDDARRPLGIVVLNFDASLLLGSLSAASVAGSGLLDDQGYWLHAADPADEMAFANGDDARRLGMRDPEAWQRIHESGRSAGQFEARSGLWSFRRVAPASEVAGLQAPVWYAVSIVPAKNITAVRIRSALEHGLLALALLAATSGLSLGLARSRQSERRTARDLARSTAELAEAGQQLEASRDELVRSERLSSLGLMVAGVAHEINTPLGAAMLAGRVLEEQLDALRHAYRSGLRRTDMERFEQEHREGLALLSGNLRRVADLIHLFKQVATDRAAATRQHFDLAAVVHDVLALMAGTLKHVPHRVEVDIPPGIAMDSFPGPLGQIVQNLVNNALDHAFPQGGPGQVLICGRGEGERVVLSVGDNGCGIAAADMPHIWDPFFTTRRHRGGTGLGLHICHQLATAVLGGRIEIAENGTGRGCTVRLEIPAVAPAGGAVP